MDRLPTLLKMLESGQDNAMLRFAIGNEYLNRGEWQAAAQALGKAVQQDANWSAAWKFYGRALMLGGDTEQAAAVLKQGLEVARERGDKQAAKEMQVYLKRIDKGDIR